MSPNKIKLYMIKSISIYLLLAAFISVSGCSSRLFTVYRIDVQQGNIVDPAKVEQLQIGMTKEQVQFLMGTPLITDVFHPDRWDYVYHLIPDYGDNERRHVAIFFEGDSVVNIEKSDVPPPQATKEEKEETTSES